MKCHACSVIRLHSHTMRLVILPEFVRFSTKEHIKNIFSSNDNVRAFASLHVHANHWHWSCEADTHRSKIINKRHHDTAVRTNIVFLLPMRLFFPLSLNELCQLLWLFNATSVTADDRITTKLTEWPSIYTNTIMTHTHTLTHIRPIEPENRPANERMKEKYEINEF